MSREGNVILCFCVALSFTFFLPRFFAQLFVLQCLWRAIEIVHITFRVCYRTDVSFSSSLSLKFDLSSFLCLFEMGSSLSHVVLTFSIIFHFHLSLSLSYLYFSPLSLPLFLCLFFDLGSFENNFELRPLTSCTTFCLRTTTYISYFSFVSRQKSVFYHDYFDLDLRWFWNR